MSIPEIITRIYNHSKRTGRIPSVKDKDVASVFKEVNRKIGSSRKALYIAGLIGEARKKSYPQLSFMYQNGYYRLDQRSMELLKRICNGDRNLKDKII